MKILELSPSTVPLLKQTNSYNIFIRKKNTYLRSLNYEKTLLHPLRSYDDYFSQHEIRTFYFHILGGGGGRLVFLTVCR